MKMKISCQNKNYKWRFVMAAIVNEEKCTGCGACVGECPVDAIEMKADKACVDEDTCIDCGACVGACPVEAITD